LLLGSAAAEVTPPPPNTVEHVQVPSFDGTLLDGWLVRPANVPQDTKLPIVLWSGPYFGQCDFYPFPTDEPPPRCHYGTGDDPDLWDNDTLSEAVPVDFLLAHGYAVAIFNVRGTGNSGGCFSWLGPAEQRDQAFLVEWLAKLPWSNGRIGMMGLSYHGTTPWEAAVQNPPHLKTIVVAGMIGDAYEFSHSPEGATGPATISVFDNNFVMRTTLSPPINSPPPHWTVEHFPVLPERLCPDLVQFMTDDASGLATDIRDPSFWEARDLYPRFPQIKSAVFLTHGFQDLWLSGHQFQEDPVWRMLAKAPKRMLEGQWQHEFPNFDDFKPDWALSDWNDRLLGWLDFWLKGDGRGKAPGQGLVDYQDGTGAWHSSTAWPPAEAHSQVLYLSDGKLAPQPGSAAGSESFRSYPQAEKLAVPELYACPQNLVSDQLGPGGITYVTAPVAQPTLVAGNAFAYLSLESDLPGGQAGAFLYDIGPNFSCNSDGTVTDVRALATGAADLRFYHGNYLGTPFPTGQPTRVRIDLTNLAEVLQPGHRLGLSVSYGDYLERINPYTPELTVHADGGLQASQLIVPVVSGGFGGKAPKISYPPRPFVPTG